jgi:hypothetical protein
MTQRDRTVIIVVVCVLALGGFWMLALKPKRHEAADLGRQLDQASQRLDDARSQVSAGEAARGRYGANYATVARLGKAVPTDDDVPSLVYQLDSTAKTTGVDFRTIKLTAGAAAPASPGNAAQAAASTQDNSQNKAASQDGKDAGANAAPSNGTQTNATQAPSTTPTPTTPTQSATAGLPPGAVVGTAGLSTMPFSFTFQGSFFKLSEFFTRLERYIKPRRKNLDVSGRLLLIDGISLSASTKGFPTMTAAIAAQAYLLPVDQGLFDGASPQGPSALSSEPVSNSGGASPVTPAVVAP